MPQFQNLPDESDTWQGAGAASPAFTGYASNALGVDEDWFRLNLGAGSYQISVLPGLIDVSFDGAIDYGPLRGETTAAVAAVYQRVDYWDLGSGESSGVMQLGLTGTAVDDLAAQGLPFDTTLYFSTGQFELPQEHLDQGFDEQGHLVWSVHYTNEYYIEVLATALPLVPDLATNETDYSEQAGRYLVTIGNPTGQRAANWGSDWIEQYEITVSGLPDELGPELQPGPDPDHTTVMLLRTPVYHDEGAPIGWMAGAEPTEVPSGIANLAAALSGKITDKFLDFLHGVAEDNGLAWLTELYDTATKYNGIKAMLIGFNDDLLKYMNQVLTGEITVAQYEAAYTARTDTLRHDVAETVGGEHAGQLYDLLRKIGLIESHSDPQFTVLFDVGSDAWLNTLAQGHSDVFVGRDGPDWVTSGDLNDMLFGTGGEDRLDGQSGNDVVDGGDDRDIVMGGSGNDEVDGGAAGDIVLGGGDDDRAYGGDGDDYAAGGDGNDSIGGDDGDDCLAGGAGSDLVYGGGGDDLVMADGGGVGAADIAYGGDGNDAVLGMAGGDTLYGDAGEDWVSGDDVAGVSAGNDLLYGGAGADIVIAGAGNDSAFGGEDVDAIDGQAGDDRLYGDGGGDFLQGGTGNDLLAGGAGGDTIFGGAAADTVYGGAPETAADDAANTVWGGEGDDRIYGGTAADTISGDAGNDVLLDATVGGASGLDVLYGADGSDFLLQQDGDDTLYGGAGDDILSYSDDAIDGSGKDTGYGDTGDDTIFLGADDDRAYGGEGDDILTDQAYGSSGNDGLWGGAGEDTLLGWTGDDRLYGDAGDDVLAGASGHDLLFGGAGNDIFVLFDATGVELDDPGSDTIADWNAGDAIELDGLGVAAFGDLLITAAAGGAHIAAAGTSIDLTVLLDPGEALGADDFLFAP